MTALHRLFARQHGRAGSLAEELPWWSWIDERTLLTRGGSLLTAAEVTPHPTSAVTPERMEQVVDAWTRALGQLDGRTRLGLYLTRRPARPAAAYPAIPHPRVPDDLLRRREEFVARRAAETRLVAAWCYQPRLRQPTRTGRSDWLAELRERLPAGAPRAKRYLASSVRSGRDRLRQIVEAQRALVARWCPSELLGPGEATAWLGELVNRPGSTAPASGGSGLHWQIARAEVEAHRRHLTLDGEPAVVYSLLEPPPRALANLVGGLLRLDVALTAHWEFRRLTTAQARKRIRTAQKHYFGRRYSMLAHATDTQSTDAALLDAAADAEVDRLAQAHVELETDAMPYGDLAAGLTLHGDLDRLEAADAELAKIYAGADAKLLKEGYGGLAQFFARLPGQPASRQFRTVTVSGGAACALAPLFAAASGYRRSRHLGAPPLALFETRDGTPYRMDLFHGGDVGHTLVLGATGAGKSFLLNFLLLHALQYNPRICILDLGGSYRALTELLGGGYLSLQPGDAEGEGTPLAPFALPENERTLHFLAGWIERLLGLGGYRAAGDDASEIRGRLEDLYRLPLAERSLSHLAQVAPPRMKPALARWCRGGAWGAIFDTPGAGDLEVADWQVIDLAAAAAHPDLAAAAMSYFLERLRLEVESPDEATRLKLVVVDEGWRFLGDPQTAHYLVEAAKTWRKRNAALVLASQSAGDVLGAAEAATLIESLPHRLYLSNPDLPTEAAEALQLAPAEIQLIRTLEPKRELYLRTQGGGEVLRLEVDPESYWMFTSNPVEASRRAAAVQRHGGVAAAIAALARERGEAGSGRAGAAAVYD